MGYVIAASASPANCMTRRRAGGELVPSRAIGLPPVSLATIPLRSRTMYAPHKSSSSALFPGDQIPIEGQIVKVFQLRILHARNYRKVSHLNQSFDLALFKIIPSTFVIV